MRPLQLVHRSLAYYWRTNVAVVCGVGVAVAVLAGALLVGESVRASLRELAVGRLGRTDHLIASTHFFRQALAHDIAARPEFTSCCATAYGLIALDGIVLSPDNGTRAAGVAIYGIDEDFWKFHDRPSPGELRPREAWVSEALARELRPAQGAATNGSAGSSDAASIGSVLVRLQQPSAIPLASLHGRRDEAGTTIRVNARGGLPASAMGEFSLRPRQGEIRAIFLPIARLQADLGQADRINAILIAARAETATGADTADRTARALEAALAPSLQLEDAALKMRPLDSATAAGAFVLESDSGLLTDAIADVALRTAASQHLLQAPVFTYLAYTIRSGDREIPYSVVSAVDYAEYRAIAGSSTNATTIGAPTTGAARRTDAASTSVSAASARADAGCGGAPPIWLNAWAADALGVAAGAPVHLDFDVWEDAGGLVRRGADFTLAGVMPMQGLGADRSLTPDYPGITGQESLSDWDPPFPLELSRITPRDENYWKQYRAAPKAIICPGDAARLWGSRFGKYTSIRFGPGAGLGASATNSDASSRAETDGTANASAGAGAGAKTVGAGPAANANAASKGGASREAGTSVGPAASAGATANANVGAMPSASAANAGVTQSAKLGVGAAGGDAMDGYRRALQAALQPSVAGFIVQPVRATALAAASGTTDFGEYFLYFSFFIVVSGLLLAGLFFRLGVEQRLREVGLLQAIGYKPALVRRLFLLEGTYLAIAGSLLGAVGALLYASFIMYGLRTWWVGAVGTTALTLKPSANALLIGAIAGVITAVLTIALTLRGIMRVPSRSLLHGEVTAADLAVAATNATSATNANSATGAAGAADGTGATAAIGATRAAGATPAQPKRGGFRDRARRRVLLFALFAILAIALTAASAVRVMDQTGGFFGAGGSALIAALLGLSIWLRRAPSAPTPSPTARALWRFGQTNAAARPGRTVLSVALIAFATFVVVTVGAFRQEGVADPDDRRSGTGGYSLIAESVAPITDDPNTAAGRAALGLDSPDLTLLNGLSVARFRLRPGDDGSCLNLYRPENPRIIAPTRAFTTRGGRFSFAGTLAGATDAERANPWLLLNHQFSDGAVPVIADFTSLMYVFHRAVGEDITVPRGSGRPPITLRVVAALSHSVFQSELIIGEPSFERLFPGNEGYRLFLVQTPRPAPAPIDADARDARAAQIGRTLQERLADFGVEATRTTDRLRAYQQVENTYLSTFQALGALGLILGTLGVGTVLLRNILERRRELALLRAIGYREGHVRSLILAESVSIVVWGLAAGTLCALLAVVPAIAEHGGRFPWTAILGLLVAVLGAGLVSSIAATAMAVRLPLLASLRAE
jgi:hypothetical protein